MRLSVFNLYVENYPDADSTLVHNTLSGAYVVLENEALEVLRRADRGEKISCDEQEIVDEEDLWDEDVAVVVESRASEERDFRDWFERQRSNRVLSCIVGVNLACNYDCPYCLQAEVMSGKVMSHETCDQTAAWLVRRAKEIKAESLDIGFIGGEPLLHPKRLARVAEQVRSELKGRDIGFSFSVTTNASLLTDQILDLLIPLGLEQLQITIDGDESTHDLTRVSKDGKARFQQIFDATIRASKRVRVIVNGNYEAHTISGFGPLLDKLAEAGLTPGSLVEFSPALEGLATKKGGVGSGACTYSSTDMRYQAALHDKALQNGFEPSGLLSFGPCSYHERHSFAIDPTGAIYVCPGFLGMPKWGVGQVASGLREKDYMGMVNQNPQRACGGCAHRPNCSGGCVAVEWIAKDRMEGVVCERSYFDSQTHDGVIRGYLRETLPLEEALKNFPEPTELPPKEKIFRLPMLT